MTPLIIGENTTQVAAVVREQALDGEGLSQVGLL